MGIKHNRGYSKRFIATVLQSKHPDIFKDVEDARYYIHKVTGAHGEKSRKQKIDKQLMEDFALLENPITECELKPFIVPKQYKTVSYTHLHSKPIKQMDIRRRKGLKRIS